MTDLADRSAMRGAPASISPGTAQIGYPRREHQGGETTEVWNWAGNSVIAATSALRTPNDEAELRSLISTRTGGVRVVGSRMSSGRMLELAATGDLLLDLQHLSGLQDSGDDWATFGAGSSLQDIYTVLSAMGKELPASPGVIASQSLAGALATGTHGQGLRQSSIADAALAVRMVLADGSVLELDRAHPWFPAVQLGLGVLGVVTSVTLRTQRSLVWSCAKAAVSAAGLEHDLLAWNRGNALAKAWWFPDQDLVHVWTAREADEAEERAWRENGGQLVERTETSDAMNKAVEQTLSLMRTDVQSAEDQHAPFRTVTRFKDFTDVTGDVYQVFCRGIATPQINVEIGVPLDRAPEVITAIRRWYAGSRQRTHYPVILRCTGPAEAWLSPSSDQDTCFFGFVVYYAEDGSLSQDGVEFLHEAEQLLASFGGRPHWGKYFDEARYDWSALYPRWQEFLDVREALDPGHAFANAFTERVLR